VKRLENQSNQKHHIFKDHILLQREKKKPTSAVKFTNKGSFWSEFQREKGEP